MSKCRNFETRNWGWMSQNEILKIRCWEKKCSPFNSASVNRSTFSKRVSLTRNICGRKRYYPLFFTFCKIDRFFDISTWRRNAKKTILTTAIESRIIYKMTEKFLKSNRGFERYGPPKCQKLPKFFWKILSFFGYPGKEKIGLDSKVGSGQTFFCLREDEWDHRGKLWRSSKSRLKLV